MSFSGGGVENNKKKYNCKKKFSNIWSFQKKAVPLRPNFACAGTSSREVTMCASKKSKEFKVISHKK